MEETTTTLQPDRHRLEEQQGPSTSSSIADDEVEFEFPLVSRDSPAGTAAPADELFADGRIRCSSCPVSSFFVGQQACGGTAAAAPATPAAPAPPRVVRGQLGRLFLEESRAKSSSSSSVVSFFSSDDEDDDDSSISGGGGGLEGAPPESYCLWTPGGSSSSPRPPRKSGSTGSSVARWRRISDLVVGARRSRSDGKDRFITFFVPAAPRTKRLQEEDEEQSSSTVVVRKHQVKPSTAAATSGVRRKQAAPAPAEKVDAAAAQHRVAAPPRRTFLPYREELVGFFANVNGVSRSHHHHHSPFLTSS